VLAYMPADHLITDHYALSWLLRRALGVQVEAVSGAQAVAARMGEDQEAAHGWCRSRCR
jgi:hypothetical protein